MKLFQPKVVVLLIATGAYVSSCTSDIEILESYKWKHGGGVHIGDFVSFKRMYKVTNDTIYKNDEKVAVIKELKKRIDGSRVLIIKSISSDSTGTYFAK